MRRPPLATLVLLLPVPLASQSPTVDFIQQARTQMSANALDSAAALLRTAMASATQRSDSVNAYTWRGILAFMQGSDSATRMEFHHALQLDSSLQVPGLERASPRLARLFEQERLELRPGISFVSSDVDEKPRRLSGPPVVYPPDMLRRQVRGQALVGLTVDTLGHAEERSLVIVATPDSGMNNALRSMVLASTFSPGRIHGRKVRTLIELAIDLVPGTPPNATSLVTAARGRLAVHETANALAFLRQALDPMTRATEGERVYAQLVEGIAWKEAGRDTLSREAFDSALAGYQQLTARGVELAPFLKRLADSVRLARSGRTPGALGSPAVLEAVDTPPVPISHPAINYPPEMQALRVGGTVVVEARVDARGHVLAGTVRVVQSPNPGLEREAMRVVTAAVYKPARRGGQAVAVTIRQPITFAPY
ncbi:MAG TPA: energy transducer TonB [Gemmatimonadales bacterium]|nr:energy transducer TonB [Gemmatimonadales bacterium]